MKYIVMLGDGMADWPRPELGGKTPLDAAKKPNMDYLAQHGTVGLARTVPEGMSPGSDTANLSVIGYDPRVCYTGRSPLEAVSMGIEMGPNDLSYRCNVVELSDTENYEDATMIDYSCEEIPTEESTVLINFLNEHFQTETMHLYPGVSYRHCLLLKDAKPGSTCTPPHDITGKPIRDCLPGGEHGVMLLDLMKRSRELLRDHPVNKSRVERGLRPVSSCWFWGEGTRPGLTNFEETYGVKGAVISAVDLLKGIGLCAGMKSIDVPGATGTIDTNFDGKAKAAIDFLRNEGDLVYIHVEAPDECGHHGQSEEKVRSIELIDEKILGPVIEAMRADGEPFAVLLAPDHPTPLEVMTHVSDPIPFVLYRSDREGVCPAQYYSESAAAATGLFLPDGWKLMSYLVSGSDPTL